jgi:hypothetical protein
MFEDTSNYGYENPYQPQQPQQQIPPQQQQQQQQQPMMSPFAPSPEMFQNQQFQQMGMQMGQQFIGNHAEQIKAKASEYIPTTRLRYLFAVDNSYVLNKIKIILLPWLHGEWSLKYQSDANNPVAPR